MKFKKYLLGAVLAATFMMMTLISDLAYSRDVPYSEPLTEFEVEVYNVVEEKNAEQDLSVLDKDYEKKRDKIYTEVAEMYGLDYATVVDIIFTVNIKDQMDSME
ncbi:hypothetical protein ACFL5Y_00685 [Candidatus Omnitrophota bacterium]